jgi:hypothetical protein
MTSPELAMRETEHEIRTTGKRKKGKEGVTMWADVRLGLGQLGPQHHQKGDKRNRSCNAGRE